MLMVFLFLLISFLLFYSSTFHILFILLFIEMTILSCVYFMFSMFFSWFSFLCVIMVGVVLGAYGVSLLVCNSRSKGDSYFVSF